MLHTGAPTKCTASILARSSKVYPLVLRSFVDCRTFSPQQSVNAVLSRLQEDNVQISARNVEHVEVNFASAVRVYDILRADKIVVEEEALKYLQVWCLQYTLRFCRC